MEVTVLEADNVPDRPLLDVRMGPSRQRAPLEVHRTVALPDPGSPGVPVEVGLFERLSSQTLPVQEHGTREVQIPVRSRDGLETQVRLRVRSSAPAERFADEVASVASGPRRSPLGSSQASLLHTLGASSSMPREDEDMDRVLDWFQGMMGDVMREQPGDPLAFMLQKLRQRKEETTAQLADIAAACAASAASGASGDSQTSTAAPSGGSSHDLEASGEVPTGSVPTPRVPDQPPPRRSGRILGRQARQKAPQASGESSPSQSPRRQAPSSPSQAATTADGSERTDGLGRRAERSNSKVAARFSISMILQGSACQAAMHESWRDKARKEKAAEITKSVCAAVTMNLLSEVRAGGTLSRCPSRAGRKSTLTRAHGSGEAAGSEESRPSLPMPIVALGGDRTSWGQWLASP